MSATKKQKANVAVSTTSDLAVPDAEQAISIVNHWLHTDVAMLVHVSRAVFNPATRCWHLPVQLSYPRAGTLGIIGDIFLNARNGQFVNRPEAEDLQERAVALAKTHGFGEEEDVDDGQALVIRSPFP